MKTKRWFAFSLALILILAFASPAVAEPLNLITNGDFEDGNTGFTSDFTYVPIVNQSSMYPPAIYSINIDPNLGHGSWTSFGDHTTGDGNMMIVNGFNDPDDEFSDLTVWEQTVIIPPRSIICTPVESSFELLAGQHMLVGNVVVQVIDGNICVKFVLDDNALADGWLITETHVAIADDEADIPQTKKGNSIPGQFPLGESFDPGVVATDFYCMPIGDMTAPYAIAAHAVVEQTECVIIEAGSADIISDTSTMVTNGNLEIEPPYPAVQATAADGYNANTWPSATGSDSWSDPAPLWIWESDPEVHPNAGDLVTFEKTFDIPGTPADSHLMIAVDNGYAVWVNDQFIGSDNLFEGVGGLPNSNPTETDLREALAGSNLTQPYVDTTTWQTVGHFTIDASYLQTGMNTLKILGVNEGFSDNPQYPTVQNDKNPGGLVYYLDVQWNERTECIVTGEETAWGNGERFTPKNWATYIVYTPECIEEEIARDFEFSFWAANSHEANPASLDVFIGEGADPVSSLDLPEDETGIWHPFTYTLTDPAPGPMRIYITDATSLYHGDDFCIDDIALVEIP